MVRSDAEFVVLVLDLSRDFYKRRYCENREAALAAQKISDRYNELKSKLGFEDAANQANVEFLMSIE